MPHPKSSHSKIAIGSTLFKQFSMMRLSLAGLILIFASVGTYLLISSRAASTLTADFNSDGVVNVTDLSVLATNWGRTTATHAQGDANSDGTINIYDLSILASQWGQAITPVPTVTFNASPNSVTSGQSSTLTWSTTNATSCTASGAWSGSKSTSGSTSTGALTSSSTYTLSCTGSGGTTQASTTVSVSGGGTMTTSGSLTLNNVHDVVYDNVDFEGAGTNWGADGGLILIEGNSYNITFRNCIIGTNQDGLGNAVKIYTANTNIHDITFENCTIKYQPRMGIEVNDRSNAGNGYGYQRVNIINCTFEASAGEAISYDDDGGASGNSTVSGNLIKGAGVGSSYTYGEGFEINGPHNMTVTGNTFWAARDGIWNLQMHDTNDSGWVFTNNIVDATKIADGVTWTYDSNPIMAFNIYGGVFSGNTITNNAPAWAIAYMSGDHNMDWRTTTWHDARGGSYLVPQQLNGSSGNQF